MPWTNKRYPDSMKYLPKAVREKAIEIANALLEEKQMEEGTAIATAISRSKDWAVNHGLSIESTNPESKITDLKIHGEDRYVIPYDDRKWAIRNEGDKVIEAIFETKAEAVKEARMRAKAVNGAMTIQKRDGKIEKRVSYNPNRRKRKI